MKIFNKDYKWNFVDDRNVFVGYDNGQSCCENADYLLTFEPPSSLDEPKLTDLDGYNFDKKFFQEYEFPQKEGYSELESGAAVMFKLKKKNKKPIYLTLFNAHNGYYGHGFEAKIKGLDWHKGCL